MNQLSLNVKKLDLFQKIIVVDSYLDYPLSNDSFFSLIGWLKSETNEIVRLELIHTMTVLLKSRNNKVIGK